MLRRNWWKLSIALVPAIAFAFVALPALGQEKKDDKKPADAKKDDKKPDTKKETGKTIIDTAKEAGNLKTFVELVDTAGLTETLKGAGPYTVFAPTDEAFAKIKKEDLDGWKKDKAKLAGLLKYHVASSKMMAAEVQKAKEVKTLQGAALTVTVKDGKVMIGTANVVKADIAASNGVIHTIDAVQMVPAKKEPEKTPEAKKPATGG